MLVGGHPSGREGQADRSAPVDVSLAGGGGPSTIPYQAGLSCIERIADQANGGCLDGNTGTGRSSMTAWVLWQAPNGLKFER